MSVVCLVRNYFKESKLSFTVSVRPFFFRQSKQQLKPSMKLVNLVQKGLVELCNGLYRIISGP